MSKDQYYDSKEERDDKKSAEKNFADMLNTQFNMNELFNRYSDYDYSASPNIPKEDHKYRRRQPGFNEPDQKIPEINPYESPFEPRWPYQRTTLPPYQNPYRQKTQEEVDAENAFNDQMADVLRRFEEQQRIERQADLRERSHQCDFQRDIDRDAGQRRLHRRSRVLAGIERRNRAADGHERDQADGVGRQGRAGGSGIRLRERAAGKHRTHDDIGHGQESRHERHREQQREFERPPLRGRRAGSVIGGEPPRHFRQQHGADGNSDHADRQLV